MHSYACGLPSLARVHICMLYIYVSCVSREDYIHVFSPKVTGQNTKRELWTPVEYSNRPLYTCSLLSQGSARPGQRRICVAGGIHQGLLHLADALEKSQGCHIHASPCFWRLLRSSRFPNSYVTLLQFKGGRGLGGIIMRLLTTDVYY